DLMWNGPVKCEYGIAVVCPCCGLVFGSFWAWTSLFPSLISACTGDGEAGRGRLGSMWFGRRAGRVATTRRGGAGRCAALLMFACRDRMSGMRRMLPLTNGGAVAVVVAGGPSFHGG